MRTARDDRQPQERGKTVLVGLVGKGIQLSRTPLMHEAEGAALGLAYVYRLLDTDRMANEPSLADLLNFAEHFGFTGLNVTYPYKQEIIPLLDELSENARAVGSVNTVVLRGGKRFGHNTDLWGFAESFRRGMAGAACDRVVLIGAGGAGVAVAHALMECGVGMLLLHDTERERTRQLHERLAARFPGRSAIVEDLADVASGADGIVNATPIGMASKPGTAFPLDLIGPASWVADIIYFPLETELLRGARAKGCRVLSGEGMAVFQAVRAFELFTGIKPDIERMKATFASFDR